jgi:hypothetical protein
MDSSAFNLLELLGLARPMAQPSTDGSTGGDSQPAGGRDQGAGAGAGSSGASKFGPLVALQKCLLQSSEFRLPACGWAVGKGCAVMPAAPGASRRGAACHPAAAQLLPSPSEYF